MNQIRILLAEDHLVVREGLRQLLKQEKDLSVVGEASDGEEAAQLAAQLEPDLVVIDIAMPKLNGIEATKRIKMSSPATAVLILSAYDNDAYIFASLEAGAAGYLLKTAGGDELINAIRAVYSGEPVFHPVVARKVIDYFRRSAKASYEAQPSEVLSEREMQVLKLAAKGMGNKSIAHALSLSTRTVEGHLRSIFNKLGVASRTEAVLYGLRKAWFTLEDTD